MPVRTFLSNTLAWTRGSRHLHTGRHTRNFYIRADRQSKTPAQRRIWLSTVLSADEVIASLAGLEKRRTLGALEPWQAQARADGESYIKALRAYLSALLLLYGTCKEDLLAKLGMQEKEFMEAWQSVFQYGMEDKAVFDDVLSPAFRLKGVDGLVCAAGDLIREALFAPGSPFGKDEQSALQDLLVDDLAALKRNLARPEEKPATRLPSFFRKKG